MTGWQLTLSMPAMMRCLISCFDVTRIWRRTERANLEKEALDQVEPGAVLGREGKVEAAMAAGCRARLGFPLEMCARNDCRGSA